MNRKKIIAIVCAVAVVIAAAVAVTLYVLRDRPADIRDTPIPQQIDASAAQQISLLADVPFPQDAEAVPAEDGAVLFGNRYDANEYTSGDDSDSLRKTEYLSDAGSVAYTSIRSGSVMSVYDAEGQILYYSGKDKVDADYLTEPVHWFYRDGAAVCGELCFYDGENTGVAYYDADGALLCIRTEVYEAGSDGKLQMNNTWYDSDFSQIDEDAFRALIPQTDHDAFLLIEWT